MNRCLQKSLITFLNEEKYKGRSYINYICLCGAAGKTRKDYANKIKSCRKCQHKCEILIEDNTKRWCGKCSSVKLVEEFTLRKDGSNRNCKQCETNYRKANQKRITKKVAEWYASNPEKRLYYTAKHRAKNKNLQFNLSINDIVIPEVCPILGIKIDSSRSKKDNSPSLDRIDSFKGYTKENVQVISWRANWIKNNATVEELSLIAQYMLNLESMRD